jgi:DNA segregation ATPase FtsK/SpoIIIE, S-DNA-T family
MSDSDRVFAEILAAAVCAVVVVALFVWRRPRLAAMVVLSTAVWCAARVPGLVLVAGTAGVMLILWRLLALRSFRRMVSAPMVRARRGRRYRRMWPALTAAHRLSWAPHPKTETSRQASTWELIGRKPVTPKLEAVEIGKWVDRLRVRMLPGQVPADWEDAVEGIAHALGARDGRVRVAGPGRITIDLAHHDPVAVVVPALAVPAVADLAAVPVGIGEDGGMWCVRLAGSHLLVAGVTGAGKGSVIWSLLRGICPAIAAGTAQVWAIDPKGGMELGPGRALFARFAADDFDAMADLLDTAVSVMRARAGRLAGHSRSHQASVEEPLIVVVIDELANLTAYLPDRKLKDRIAQAVSLLLTQGRAVGVVVVAALQDPRKEVIAFRNLFPTKVALRLDEPVQVNMVLGDGARDQGARCDQIPESLPGVGYVRVDGVREPLRVRAAWVTDTDIVAMAAGYPAPSGDRCELRP